MKKYKVRKTPARIKAQRKYVLTENKNQAHRFESKERKYVESRIEYETFYAM